MLEEGAGAGRHKVQRVGYRRMRPRGPKVPSGARFSTHWMRRAYLTNLYLELFVSPADRAKTCGNEDDSESQV